MASPLTECLIPGIARERLRSLMASRPDLRILNLILGPERIWEYVQSIEAATDPVLLGLYPPLPPVPLRQIVSDWQSEMFLWTGYVDVRTFLELADRHLVRAAGSEPIRILDFGAGCGRLSRFLDVACDAWDAAACDVNKDMVAWCASHFSRVRTFVNGVMPPLPPAAPYDLIFGLSVFTHLDLDPIRSWLSEFGRVVRPGGIAMFTTHGTRVLEIMRGSADLQHWFRLGPEEIDRSTAAVARGSSAFFRYDREVLQSANAGAAYGTTFLSEQAVREIVRDHPFELVEFVSAGLRGWQDIYVLRRKA